MSTFVRVAGCVASALLMAGCVMPDQLAKLQKDVADLRQQMQTAHQEQSANTAKVADLEKKLAEGGEVKRTDFADLKAEVDAMQRDLAAVDERSNDLQRRMDRVSQDVARAHEAARRPVEPPPVLPPTDAPADAAPGAAPTGAVPSAAPTPEGLYNTAYADFSKGSYALAISGFEEYVAKYPDTGQADNALYWIGECHYSEGRFDQAVEAFDKLLETYPDSDKAAAANLKKGLAYLEQNDVKLAIVQLRYVTTTYPSSDEAKIARDKLTSLGAGRS